MKKQFLRIATLVLAGCASSFSQETLPPLKDGKVPQTVEALWADFDPRAEPLEVEILKEWEEEGVVLRVLRYRIGIFKGRKAMMAAVYGYPKGGSSLPGLVQIHGGGQYAITVPCSRTASAVMQPFRFPGPGESMRRITGWIPKS